MTECNRKLKAELGKGYWHLAKTESLWKFELEQIDVVMDSGGELIASFKSLGSLLLHLLIMVIVFIFWFPLLYVAWKKAYKVIDNSEKRAEDKINRVTGNT
jgi:hypothetical protein